MILTNVSKHYGPVTALSSLTLELSAGEITAVLGESGAGKTTLLNVLAGLVPFEGTVDGAAGSRPVRRRECAYLFQDLKLLPNLTAEGNCRFVLPKEQWGEVGPMLARVGLGGREGAYPHELSGGEKQRVAIARAFLYPHSLLLMDEPFSSLDLKVKRSLIELVTGLWAERRGTVVFVTHDVHEAAVMAHRALVLSKGEIVGDVRIGEPFPRDFTRRPEAEDVLTRLLLGDDVSP